MMKAYPNYKDSGVPWLGDVPEHWEVFRLGSQFAERKQKVSDKDFAPLSVTKKGILPQLDTAAKSNDGDNRKKVCSGDFVINSRSDRKGSSGVSPHTGSVSLINTVLTPISLDGRYAHNFFRSHSFQEEFYRVGRGIVADLWSTKYADMRTIMIPVPSGDEQQQISRYLDWQTSKINTFIKAKKKLIALLKEQKQNIINEAVTKGIDPDVEMKDSGVEWLGKIPKHWGARKLLYACNLIVDGTHFSPENGPEGDFLYITAKNIKEYGVKTSNATFIKAKDHYPIYKRCPAKKGDVLYIKDGATSGIATVNQLDEEFSLLSSVALIKPKTSVFVPDFLVFQLNSQLFKTHVLKNLVGGAMTRFTIEIIKKFTLVTPPIEEQMQIADYIRKNVAPIETTILKAEREIELIQEYRTRLVSDVVTGKVDVRSVEIPAFEPVEAELEAQDDEESEDELITEDIEE